LKNKNKNSLLIVAIIIFNLLAYSKPVKTLVLTIYLKYISFFAHFFGLKLYDFYFYNENKDYVLRYTFACTTFPFFVFVFSLYFLINPSISKDFFKKTLIFILLSELINLARMLVIFYVYSNFNLSYDSFYFFHLSISALTLIVLMWFFVKIFDFIKIYNHFKIKDL